MDKKNKWFKPKQESGWHKDLSEKTRWNIIYRNTSDDFKGKYERNLLAEQQLNALANVTKDKETKRKAESDAEYFKRRREAIKRKNKKKLYTRKSMKHNGQYD